MRRRPASRSHPNNSPFPTDGRGGRSCRVASLARPGESPAARARHHKAVLCVRRPSLQSNLRFSSVLPDFGRGGRIRTDDIQLPKLALYQAELRPVFRGNGMITRIGRVRNRRKQDGFEALAGARAPRSLRHKPATAGYENTHTRMVSPVRLVSLLLVRPDGAPGFFGSTGLNFLSPAGPSGRVMLCERRE